MKITIYTVSQCQFSKAEKEYLQLHNLPFEEKNLEQNREWLTEMLAVSNNFAGTPVTKIEKDDGSIVVLKGFTKEEFDKELGIEQPTVAQANAQVNLPQQTPSPEPQSPQQPQASPSPQSTIPQSSSQPSTSQSQLVDQKQEEPSPPQPSQPFNQPQQEEPSLSSVVEESPEKLSNNPPPNDQLNTILEDLKTKSQTQTPQPQSQSTTDLPNIPDFKDNI